MPTLTPDETASRLAPIVFRIEWREGLDEDPYQGTGFVISSDGLALTAFHNLPPQTRADRKTPIRAFHNGKETEVRWKTLDGEYWRWQEQLDVAVLETDLKELRPPRLAHIDPGVSRSRRASWWRGHPVAVMGFPLRRRGTAKRLLGTISADEPIADPEIFDDNWKFLGYGFESLNFGADLNDGLAGIKGMSGAPVLSRELDAIIGVQFAAVPTRTQVYATEFCHLADKWPDFVQYSVPIEIRRGAPHGRPAGFVIAILVLAYMLFQFFRIEPIVGDWTRPDGARIQRPYNVAGQAPTTDQARLGVTLFRLRPPRPGEGPAPKVPVDGDEEWVGERIEAGSPLYEGDRVRLAVESPQPGFLYVINRELTTAGPGEPHLIFPTQRIRGGDNRLAAGRVVEIPTLEDSPAYLTLRRSRRDHTGELLSLVFTPTPIPEVETGVDQQVLPAARVELWEKMWPGASARLDLAGGAGTLWSVAERDASGLRPRLLTHEAPLPQTIYRAPAKAGEPFLVQIPLRLGY